MGKFRILIIIVLLGALLTGGYVVVDQKLKELTPDSSGITEDTSLEVGGIKWYQDRLKNYNLAVFNNVPEVFFTSASAQTVREQAIQNDLALAVNGSYYRGTNVASEHAGLLIIKGQLLEPLAFDKTGQLTHVVVLDHRVNKMSFHDVTGFNADEYTATRYSAFQTGPLLIQDNAIQLGLIAASANGESRHLRSILGYTDSGESFVMITRVNFRLADLAAKLAEFEIFSGKTINVINLDGGTSTAMYSPLLEQFNFGETKRLPIIFGVPLQN
jgi:exopolysaccharide biosynthesis protein